MKQILTIACIILSISTVAQDRSDSSRFKTMAAGPEYQRSSLYQSLWGKNYRKEWTTPVTFPITKLDTLRGGIIKFKIGGGHQSKSLHLKSKAEKEYALRSVNKSLKVLIPEIFYNTFIEHIANDAISMSNPYGALGVPVMAEAAGIPHSNPQFMWVPKQKLFDTLNAVYGDRLYLFEERASGDWSNNPDFLNFKKFLGSDELLDKMFEDNDNQADAVSFVKARMFDMLIGDWDRHWDQWKWAKTEKDGKNIYVPIPTDRDQAFSTTGGFILKTALGAAGMKYVRPFDYTIKDVTFTERRFLDRFITNQVTLDQWQTQAKALQQELTDTVISASIREMPPEIFAISGNEIIAKLKSRRNHLVEYANDYYYFLAKEVEIVGSKESEVFEVNYVNDNETVINVFDIDKTGKKKNEPFYTRTFKTGETNEVRLYGLSGNDVYNIKGTVNSGVNIRIIGGDAKDSVNNTSSRKVHVYDDHNNIINGKTRSHLSDSADHKFDYDTYRYDKKGISPLIGYSYEDKIFAGLGYNAVHHKWRKLPFASKQSIGVKYSFTQKALSAFYKGLFPSLFGKTDLFINADYDIIRWTNFYGVGNNTTSIKKDIPYHRTQSEQFLANVGLQRMLGKSVFSLTGSYQSVRIINDADRFVAKVIAPGQADIFAQINYAGLTLGYKIAILNDSIVPTAGFSFSADAGLYRNLSQHKSFQKYNGVARFYIPLFSKFSIAIRAAGGTVNGDPMFYQLPHLGGANDLRGYRRERFWGKTAFSNSNELRFITNLRSYLMNGKIGLSVFYDEGRIWQPGEISETWHTDYGAGFYLAPFNAMLLNVAYGISKERKMVQVRIIKSF
jgi:hypothetical protein